MRPGTHREELSREAEAVLARLVDEEERARADGRGAVKTGEEAA